MAAGVPVVSTPLGAEGLDVTPGENIILADPDDADSWARELAFLAESESRRVQLTESARRLVRAHYDWSTLGDLLCQTYSQWLANPENPENVA
jgi:glycosyltransferase involved in cell wall biosynthesis